MPQESFIYLDYAATSPLRDGVLDAMVPFLQDTFGNPSSIHIAGRIAASAIAKARADIANFFSVNPRNIIFTGCGTEADNQALATLVEFGKARNKNHIIISAIEHHAVLEYAHHLEDLGYNVTYLLPRKNGVVSLEDVKAAINEKTCGISIMTVNNETGIIQPISEIASFAHSQDILMHTDAIQAVGHVDVPPFRKKSQGVSLLSISAHKFGGPKGVGALIIDDGIEVASILYGGGQERGMRAGTNNVAGIVGMAAALKHSACTFERDYTHIEFLHNYFESELLKRLPEVYIVGTQVQRSPVISCVCIPGVINESLVQALDLEGICISAGSACMSGVIQESHVLSAMDVSPELARGAIRISIGYATTQTDIDTLLDALVEKIHLQKNL